MLTAGRLEKIMELETQLREQYQEQLDSKTAEVDRLSTRETELQATVDKLQGTVDTQLETLKDLSEKATANQRVEQHNRELSNRSEKQAAEIGDLKKRVKTLQKDLEAVRAENKTLTQYDPARMKKNLDANKKKLAEKQKANEALQKSLKETRQENLELHRKVSELEAKVAGLEPAEVEAEEPAAEGTRDEKAAA